MAYENVTLTGDLEEPHKKNAITLALLRYWLGRILCMRREPEPFLAARGTPS
jgi:hypothetical protein